MTLSKIEYFIDYKKVLMSCANWKPDQNALDDKN